MKSHITNLAKTLLVLMPILLLVPDMAFADMDPVEGFVWNLVTGFFGFFAAMAGLILNVGINDFVIGFGEMYTNGGIGAAVDLAWVSVRDIFNITFIFGLVYIGFKMILDSDDSSTRRWLINLIMAAILVNFSLFFTKFVVDLSNIIATEVALSGFNPDGENGVKVSETFADIIGLPSVLGSSKAVGVNATDRISSGTSAWGYIFGTMIMLIIATFVFAAGGILLIIRAVVLMIYMVLSPLMFIGWVFPQLQRYTSEYWSGFLGRAFFAPIYILLIYLSAMIVGAFRDFHSKDHVGLSAIYTGSGDTVEAGFFATMTPFILASVFLVASIVIANKMGANGASAAVSTGKSLSNKLRRGVTKHTVGYGALGVNHASEWASKKYENFDANASKGTRRAVGVLSLGALTNRNVRGALTAGQKLSIAGSETAEQRRKYEQARTGRNNQTLADNRKKEDFDGAIEKLDDVATTAKGLNLEFENLRKTIKDMSDDQRNNLGFEKLNDIRVAAHLTDNHIDALQKSGNYSNSEIAEIRTTRDDAYKTIAEKGSVFNHSSLKDKTINPNADTDTVKNSQRATLMRKDVNQLAKMPTGVFTNSYMAAYITPQALEQKMRTSPLTTDEREAIRANIDNYIAGLSGPEKERVKNQWKTWVTRSSFGAELGLTSINNNSGSNSNETNVGDWKSGLNNPNSRTSR